MNLSELHRFVRNEWFQSQFRRPDQRLGASVAVLPSRDSNLRWSAEGSVSDSSWRSIDIEFDRRFVSFYANDENRRDSKSWIDSCAAAARNKTLDIFTKA